MASSQSFFNVLLLLFIHLACFTIFANNSNRKPNLEAEQQHHQHQPSPNKRRKIAPLSASASSSTTSNTTPKPPRKSYSSFSPHSILSYLNHGLLLSFHRRRKPNNSSPLHQAPLPLSPDLTPPNINLSPLVVSSKHHLLSSFALRNDDIFPCSACGEVLSKPHHLELHQATKHSFSQLRDGDSGKNIVQIIFRSGWKGEKAPNVHRILKIHNTPKTLARFEEYREIVRSRAALDVRRRSSSYDYERCIADGNERLRFYCSTILCESTTRNGPEMVGACGSQYCSACGIVRHGFVGKHIAGLDGIATHADSWGAHASLPEELEREFAFLNVRRAMLVCRVVAGRVARGGEETEEEEEKGTVFDSVVPVVRRGGGDDEDEELLVFNPRAMLPCFVIVYST